MSHNRGGGYDDVQQAVIGAHCIDKPVCALAIAAYQVVRGAPMSEAPGPVTVTVETEVDAETAARYYALYHETFSALQVKAVARQLLHEQEFLEEMHDPRVHKYVAWDDDGEAIGLSTLTRHLETVPVDQPRVLRLPLPGHTARNAVYYLGFTLVHPHRRQTRIFQAMIDRVVEGSSPTTPSARGTSAPTTT